MTKKKKKTDEEKLVEKAPLKALLQMPDVLEEICGIYRKVTLEIEFDEKSQEYYFELCVEGDVEAEERIITRDELNYRLRVVGGFVPPPFVEKEK